MSDDNEPKDESTDDSEQQAEQQPTDSDQPAAQSDDQNEVSSSFSDASGKVIGTMSCTGPLFSVSGARNTYPEIEAGPLARRAPTFKHVVTNSRSRENEQNV
jgi:hypothetical protein